MIQIYAPNNTDYSKNGTVLLPTSCELNMEINSTWSVELINPLDDRFKNIVENAVLSVPTPYGQNLFRITQIDKTDTEITAIAVPVFLDAQNDTFIYDQRPTDKNGQEALDILMNGTKYTGHSDIDTINTAYYVMKNLIECIASDDENSFLNRWGGEIRFDDYDIYINERLGDDNGARVEFGFNLSSIQESIDMTNVATKIIPVAYNGYTLPNQETVNSPNNLNKYPIYYIRQIQYDDIKLAEDAMEDDEENGITVCDTLTELYQALRTRAAKEFDNGIDLPSITYQVDMVDLEKTLEYAEFKDLVKVNLGDTVHVRHRRLDIETEARIIALTYDCIKQKRISLTIGDFVSNYFDKNSDITSSASQVINTSNNTLLANKIAGVINLLNTSLRAQKDVAQKQDVRAILFEDLDPSSPTFGALCIGTQGIQISKERNETNTDWVWGTAINFESVNADFIITGILTDKEGKFYLNLDTGELVMSDGTFKGTLNTTEDIYVGNNIYIGQGSIQSKYIRFSDTVWINLFQQSLTFKAVDSYLTLAQTTPHEEGIAIIGARLMSEGIVELVSGSDMNCYINLQGKDNPLGEYEIDITPGPNGKGNVNLNGNLHVYGSLDVSGQKNRVVQTKNHGKRLMNAVESADAFFEDFGTAMTDVEGFCEVKLDEIFLETVNTHCTYYIQLTAYKDGNVCIFEKGENSFKVKGTTNTQFDWRISAKQKGYEDIRMEVMKK